MMTEYVLGGIPVIVTIENEYLKADISTLGAELQSLYGKKGQTEYLWQGDEKIWKGRSPLLFPFVGRLKDDRYVYEGKTYVMPKHGFAKNSEFSVKEKYDNAVVLALKSGEHTDIYPFEFTLEIMFWLVGKSLKVVHRVTNDGKKEMYFSLGAHPGFNCRIGDCILFPDDEESSAYRLTEEKLLTCTPVEKAIRNHKLTVTEDVFADDALIFKRLRSDTIALKRWDGRSVTVSFGSAPCLGIWAKKGAPYVCIEPWFGVDDSSEATGRIEEKACIQHIGPGECFRFPMTIEV